MWETLSCIETETAQLISFVDLRERSGRERKRKRKREREREREKKERERGERERGERRIVRTEIFFILILIFFHQLLTFLTSDRTMNINVYRLFSFLLKP